MAEQRTILRPSRSAIAFNRSDPQLTRRLCTDLEARGLGGTIAAELFRAQKSSDRAKVYRGGIRGVGSFRDLSYARKSRSLEKLCTALAAGAALLDVAWGWKRDATVKFGLRDSWVLYVELPKYGQISFHSPDRFAGPDFSGDWDHQPGQGPIRVVQFCDAVLAGKFRTPGSWTPLPLFRAGTPTLEIC